MSSLFRLSQLIHGVRRRQMLLTIGFGILFAGTTLIPPLLIRRLILWLTTEEPVDAALTAVVALLFAGLSGARRQSLLLWPVLTSGGLSGA